MSNFFELGVLYVQLLLCKTCSGTNFAVYGQQVMCKTHHREAFLLKGKYGQPVEGAPAAPTNAVPSAEEQPVASTAEAAETPAPSEVQAEVEQCPTPAGEARASATGAEGSAGEERTDVPISPVCAEEAPAASSDTMATAAEGTENASPAPAEGKEAEVNASASPPPNPEIPETAAAEGTGAQPPQIILRLSASTEDDTHL